MRVFISSVRGGLEAERDALPGLLKAIGQEPVRFEDFTAQPVPSRQACMDGIDSSEVYLLLLGPNYGHVFPETGQSATHDEFVRAQARGLRRLVFLKDGVEMEPKQEEFKQFVSDYGTGLFRDSFTNVTDLQTKVAAALRQLEQAPGQLTFEPLVDVPMPVWKDDWEDPRFGRNQTGAIGEVHILPLTATKVPRRVLRTMPTRLTGVLRTSGAVPAHVALEPYQGDTSAVVAVPVTERRGMNDVLPRAVRGVRIGADGQISIWWDLPTDSMPILQHQDLVDALAGALRLAGAVGVDEGARYAVAFGVSGSMLSVVRGPMPTEPRRQVSFPHFDSGRPIRLVPDESVSATAFDAGADEYAHDLATALIDSFSTRP